VFLQSREYFLTDDGKMPAPGRVWDGPVRAANKAPYYVSLVQKYFLCHSKSPEGEGSFISREGNSEKFYRLSFRWSPALGGATEEPPHSFFKNQFRNPRLADEKSE
jgi:hypothetical protein